MEGSGPAAPSESSVAEVVDRARAGSREAFTWLLHRYQAAVRGYVARYVRDEEAINDLAQEIFLAAHRRLPSYRGEAAFLTWVIGIGRRHIANHLREQTRMRRREAGGFFALVARWQEEAWQRDQGQAVRIEQELDALERCLERLHPRSAGLVSAYYFENKSAAEIGGALGKTDRAVRMLLLRIRAALRACLDSRLPAGGA